MLEHTGSRFEDSTRGRIVARLRGGPATVEELASELGLTDNAIRLQLSALERDHVARQAGVRRGGGVGKPATLYELHPDVEARLSRAYAPVLAALLEVAGDEIPAAQVRRLLRKAGQRVGESAGGPAEGDLHTRARAAAAVLEALGGAVNVEERRGSAVLRGTACPLAEAVARNPDTCEAVKALIAEVSGARVAESCDRSGRPRCCFQLAASA